MVWSSSDESVAKVSETGEVTAVSAGDAIITATSGEAAGECSISVIDNPKIGDFYYSDGTYSTDLRTDKTPIGVIFWTGDPTAEDATLKAEHPECVNGLVVSLDGEEVTTWQPNYKDYGDMVDSWVQLNTEYTTVEAGMGNTPEDKLNHIVGYNNTKAIEAFNAASENASWPVVAVSGLPAYRDKVPVPENTSGWYLPSMKEYSLLCTGEQDIKENIWDISGGENYIQNGLFINERLSMVEGSKLLEMEQSFDSVAGTYWSSQEHTESMALKLFFRFGTVSTSDKDWQYQTNGRVRYILAF